MTEKWCVCGCVVYSSTTWGRHDSTVEARHRSRGVGIQKKGCCTPQNLRHWVLPSELGCVAASPQRVFLVRTEEKCLAGLQQKTTICTFRHGPRCLPTNRSDKWLAAGESSVLSSATVSTNGSEETVTGDVNRTQQRCQEQGLIRAKAFTLEHSGHGRQRNLNTAKKLRLEVGWTVFHLSPVFVFCSRNILQFSSSQAPCVEITMFFFVFFCRVVLCIRTAS